ncbi:MAG: hypothetical protein Q9177_001628, partial [Variospora cf. flavescens]
MDPHHRKIDLQSPADLTYLQTNIQLSAQQKLELAIPASANPAGASDAFRPQVQRLVQDYIAQTLSLALPSLAVNGLDADGSMLLAGGARSLSGDGNNNNNNVEDESNYEPYDPRLGEKLRTL